MPQDVWQGGEGFKHHKEVERELSVENEGWRSLFMERITRSRLHTVD